MKETLGRIAPNGKSTRLTITLLGASAAGKTALLVRYLTGRFIGEYYSGNDMTYQHAVPYFGYLTTSIDIVDVSTIQEREDGDVFPWSERTGAFVVVYSLTDSKSFSRAVEILQRLPGIAPKFLVANKSDLQHRRQVSHEEGQAVAVRYGCSFGEFSATESDKSPTIQRVFQKLIRQLLALSFIPPHPRIRISGLSRLLVSIVSKSGGRKRFKEQTSASNSSSLN